MSKPSKKRPAATEVAHERRVGRRRVTGRSRLGMIVDGVQMWNETIYYSDGTHEVVNQGSHRI